MKKYEIKILTLTHDNTAVFTDLLTYEDAKLNCCYIAKLFGIDEKHITIKEVPQG